MLPQLRFLRHGDNPGWVCDRPRTLLVHKSFLTAWSEFFSRALNGDWKESETHTVDLTEDVPETFDLYLNLVYKNDLPVMTLDEDKLCALDTLEFLKHICKQYISLIHLYVLADKLQDIQAKNEALKAILQISYLRNHQGICIRLPQLPLGRFTIVRLKAARPDHCAST